jgi:hypothetical protein
MAVLTGAASRGPRWTSRRRCTVLGVGLVLMTSVAVVGGSAGAASKAKKTTTTTTIPKPAFSTASGTIAAMAPGISMEVQNPTSGQVTVSWTSSTRFTQTVTLASSTLAVGDCVTATSSSSSKSKASSTRFTATSVTITQPSSTGSCTAGGAFGAGGAASTGAGGASGFRPPSGSFTRGSFPRGTIPGGAAARNLTFSDAFGKVTSVSGSTFVVVGTVPVLPAKSSSKSTKKSSSSSTKLKTTTRTSKVTFTSKTTFTQTVPATSTAVVVGQCATALGPASDTGAITASTISVRAPASSGCVTSSFGGFGGGFGGRFGGAGAG